MVTCRERTGSRVQGELLLRARALEEEEAVFAADARELEAEPAKCSGKAKRRCPRTARVHPPGGLETASIEHISRLAS